MWNIINLLKKWIFKITTKDIVYGIIVVLLICALGTSVSQCSSERQRYKNNIAALTDTIHYYKAKNGQLVATKLAFETDIKDLEMLNEALCEELDNLNAKYDLVSGTHFGGVIEHEVHDTAYVVQHDTIQNGFSHDFAFNDEFRTLEGNVNYKNDTVGVKILKDEMQFDYTVAMDKNNNIYITSTNPYVKYKQITGFQVPQTRQKHWALGIYGNIAFDPAHKDRYFDVGLSLDYRIKRFHIGPTIFYEQNFKNNDKGVYIGANVGLNIFEW